MTSLHIAKHTAQQAILPEAKDRALEVTMNFDVSEQRTAGRNGDIHRKIEDVA